MGGGGGGMRGERWEGVRGDGGGNKGRGEGDNNDQ